MSTLRQVTDTFVHFLADNLPTDGSIPIKVVREDPSDRSADLLQMNALNIQFLGVSFANGTSLSTFQMVLDVVNDDAYTVYDWAQAVADILMASYFTVVKDYTNPASPVATSSNVFWEPDQVRFKRVSADTNYSHLTCTLPVRFRSV